MAGTDASCECAWDDPVVFAELLGGGDGERRGDVVDTPFFVLGEGSADFASSFLWLLLSLVLSVLPSSHVF